ncbi:VTT domain-containing protein [Acidobacteria bacterium AH-259-G07]|nr:VTT domain-containing protein [Acidobacteria bacterium AH-259-G07]
MFLATAEGFWNSVRIFIGQLYDSAVSLGGPGLFFIALADSSFLSLPEVNDILIVVRSTGQGWEAMTYYVVMTTLGSVSGCALLYSVGRQGGAFLHRLLKKKKIKEVEILYRQRGIWTVLIPSILPPPTPFKIFVLSAGLFKIPFAKFLVAVALGRSIRYFVWGILAVLYGELARNFLEKNLPAVGTVLFLLFVAAIASYVLMRSRARKKSPRQEIA